METPSKVGLASWLLFLLFVASALFVSKLPMYWLWLALGVVVCGLLVGIRHRRGVIIVSGSAAAVYIATYVLYWIAIATVIYGEPSSDIASGNRIENMLYVIAGNFQQGHIWRGLQSAYLQLIMPLIQIATLIASIVLLRQTRDTSAST
jgi:hypothetical protein